jgi:hypothetical protein
MCSIVLQVSRVSLICDFLHKYKMFPEFSAARKIAGCRVTRLWFCLERTRIKLAEAAAVAQYPELPGIKRALSPFWEHSVWPNSADPYQSMI